MPLCGNVCWKMAQKVYIYSCLVTNSDIPKCLDKWSKDLNIEINDNEIFDIILKNYKCLWWFQYKLLYIYTIPHWAFSIFEKIYNRRFLEITGEIIRRSEAPAVGHQFRYGLLSLYMSMISWQSKSTGLWQYQTFRHGPRLYWTARCALCARNTFLFLFPPHTTVFLAGPHVVCPFGMVDWLNLGLRAFIIYIMFLIKKKKCKKKTSVASATASLVVLHGLPEADHCKQRIEYGTRNSEASRSIPSLALDCG